MMIYRNSVYFYCFGIFTFILFHQVSTSAPVRKNSDVKSEQDSFVHDKKTVVFVQLNVSVHFIIPVK